MSGVGGGMSRWPEGTVDQGTLFPAVSPESWEGSLRRGCFEPYVGSGGGWVKVQGRAA